MTENLRFGADYHVLPLREHLDFASDLGFHRAVEMCNGAGICRKRPRRHDVPQLHGHPRGRAQHARPGQHAARRPLGTAARGGADQPAHVRSHGPLHRLQGLQGASAPRRSIWPRSNSSSWPTTTRHGTPLRSRLFGEHRRAQSLEQRAAGAVGQRRPRPMASCDRALERASASAASARCPLSPAALYDLVQAPPQPPCRARGKQGRPLQRHLQHLQLPPTSASPPRSCSKRLALRSAAGSFLLRPPDDLQGTRGRKRAPPPARLVAAGPLCRAGYPHRRPGAQLPADAAR